MHSTEKNNVEEIGCDFLDKEIVFYDNTERFLYAKSLLTLMGEAHFACAQINESLSSQDMYHICMLLEKLLPSIDFIELADKAYRENNKTTKKTT